MALSILNRPKGASGIVADLRANSAGLILTTALLLLEGSLGTWDVPGRLLTTCLLSIAGVLVYLRAPNVAWRNMIPQIGFTLAAGALLLAFRSNLILWQVWILLVAILIRNASASAGTPEASAEPTIWALAVLLYLGGFVLIPEALPAAMHFRETLVPGILSLLLSKIYGTSLHAGGIVFATAPLAFLFFFLLAELLALGYVRRPWRSLLGLGTLAAGTYAVLAPRALLNKGPSLEAVPGIAGATLLGGLFLRNAFLAGGDWPSRRRFFFPGYRHPWGSFSAALVLSVAVNAGSCPGTPEVGPVVVLNKGGFDWDVARHPDYGMFSSGMFGLLPYYVPNLKAVYPEELKAALAARPKVLLLINCQHQWSEEERGRVVDFVREGGGLVVLGDHTDVFGCMRGFNSLLDPLGLRFEFDAAYPTNGSFLGRMRCHLHPLADWDRADGLGIAIGASLSIRPPWYPILSARAAHSDAGIRENWMGSLLGNYRYDPGERYGDVVLVAGRTIGKGRIIVFGDTSGFQNGSCPRSCTSIIYPVLRWVSSPSGLMDRPLPRTVAISLLVLLAALGVTRSGPGFPSLVVPWIFLMATAIGSEIAARCLWSPIPLSERTVALDHFHGPMTGHYNAGRNSIGPLYLNLVRSGLLAYDLYEWDLDVLRKTRGLILVAPTRRMSEREAKDLLDYMGAGGTVILAGDGNNSRQCSALLDRFSLQISDVALGPLPPNAPRLDSKPLAEDLTTDVAGIGPRPRAKAAEQDPFAPSLVCGWEVLCDNPEGLEVLYEVSGRKVAVSKRVGTGYLVVIGDPRVFSSRNVEGTWGHHGATIRWLSLLFEKTLKGRLEGLPKTMPPPIYPKNEEWR